MRILVVEDDADLGDAVQRRLRRDGYAVDWERDGEAADDILRYQAYRLVVLDIGLPRRDGFALLRGLRARGACTPVLMLSARSEIEGRINALDIGADDYITKPFDFREFDARCRALLRRPQQISSAIVRVGNVCLDRNAKSVLLNDQPIEMPRREYCLLEILLGSEGVVLSKDEICQQLFDFDHDVGVNAIEVYMGRLRRRLGDALVIRTVRGLGYVAEAPKIQA